MSSPTSDAIDLKEDLLNSRILRYFNLPPYLSYPSSSSLSPSPSPSPHSIPTLTIHRTSQTYALSPLSAQQTGLLLLPASEARQFTNKDVIIYLDSVAQTKILFHDLWKVWYPLRMRGDMCGEDEGVLERFLAAPIRLPSTTNPSSPTLFQTLTKTHTHLTTHIHALEAEISAPLMPNNSPHQSKGKFKLSNGCASCFLVVGEQWLQGEGEGGVKVVCRDSMLERLVEERDGWVDVDMGRIEGSEGEGWKWKTMTLEHAVRAVIAIGGEEDRFEEKGTSAYFREYYEGEGWRGVFEDLV